MLMMCEKEEKKEAEREKVLELRGVAAKNALVASCQCTAVALVTDCG